jgi:hypothetical protein
MEILAMPNVSFDGMRFLPTFIACKLVPSVARSFHYVEMHFY